MHWSDLKFMVALPIDALQSLMVYWSNIFMYYFNISWAFGVKMAREKMATEWTSFLNMKEVNWYHVIPRSIIGWRERSIPCLITPQTKLLKSNWSDLDHMTPWKKPYHARKIRIERVIYCRAWTTAVSRHVIGQNGFEAIWADDIDEILIQVEVFDVINSLHN